MTSCLAHCRLPCRIRGRKNIDKTSKLQQFRQAWIGIRVCRVHVWKQMSAACIDCIQDTPNKSLQLSPRRPPGAVDAILNSMQCRADAAGQLNSMLDGCS